MSISKKQSISKLQTSYAKHQEESQLGAARRKKALYRRLTVFLTVAAVVSYLMISTLISQHSVLAEKAKEKEQLAKQIVTLKQEESNLKDKIVKLNDDDYIAKLARKDYFLSDDNEIIFTLPDDKKE